MRARGWPFLILVSTAARLAGSQSALETGRRQFDAGDLAAAEASLAPIGATSGSAALLLSRIAYRSGRAGDAVRWGEKAVTLLPDSASARVCLGRAYLLELERAPFYRQLGLSKRARAEYDRALALNAEDFEVRDARAHYYMNAPAIAGGSMDKARAEAEAARRIDPYRGALLRGQIEERDKQVGAAESEYAALVRSYPDSAGAFNRLVNLYQTSRQYTEAFRLIEARSERLPGDESALYQSGRVAALSGERLETGERALREYIARGKFSVAAEANARYRLGMILEKRNDPEGAVREYKAAVQLDPKLEDAKAALKRLRRE
jgi:tetratricopeptide (TPR) repeat protein